MSALLPTLEIHGPDGQHLVIELTGKRVTVGRLRALNDIGLEPDPQSLISRTHCIFENDFGNWWIIDNGSTNKTFVVKEGAVEIVAGRCPITDGDVIRILGRLTEAGEADYWELLFCDPLKTQPAAGVPQIVHLQYDWIQAKLFRIQGSRREEIVKLRPQGHKLIRYMDQRNRANGNVPVMCSYEELIRAIWDEEIAHSETEITHLVHELRQQVEIDPKEPQFLEAVKGLGYRLVTQVVIR